jgi:hypothetical protein
MAQKYVQLQFRGHGFPRFLSPETREKLSAAGKARALKAGSEGMSAIGRKGYQAALKSTPDFHDKGGAATQKAYKYTNRETGAIGMEAAIEAGVYKPKGKRHRYRGTCTCCTHNK